MYHYALADLCVFPSLYEPFGIVALEAAAMGKPAVVGAAGTSGLAEIVENPADSRPTGVHVNARDPGDIAWGINLALEDLERLNPGEKTPGKGCWKSSPGRKPQRGPWKFIRKVSCDAGAEKALLSG